MTKGIVLFAAAGAASVFAVSAAHAETRTFDLRGFTVVEASAGVDVTVAVGEDYSIRAEGESEALDRLRLELDGDALEVGRVNDRGFFSFGRKWNVSVYVTTPSLTGAEASSGADLSVTGIDASEFSASVSSGADATLSGTCGVIEASGSSGADLNARELKCSNAVADVSSGADLTLYATESVEADASSGGDITVYGGAKNTDIDKSSGGGVTIKD